MNSLSKSTLGTFIVGTLMTSACIDPYSGPDSYSYFTEEGSVSLCNDLDHEFDETNMTYFECVEPIYLSFEDFQKSAVYTDENLLHLEQPGKVYSYGTQLFSIDHLKGVAVWELDFFEPDPQENATRQTGYIKIPNVSDVAIKDDYLYANSYSDLVQIDLNNVSAVPVRIKDVFQVDMPTLAAQLPDSTYYLRSKFDYANGYIIGYKSITSNEIVLFEE